MKNYIGRIARNALAAGLIIVATAGCPGSAQKEAEKPKDTRPRIDYPIVDSTTIDGFVAQKLKERGNDDRIISKYFEDRQKKEIVLVTVGNTVDVVYGETTSLAKLAVGNDGKPAGPFDPTWQLTKYEYGTSDIAETAKDAAKTAGSAISTAVRDAYTYLKTGAQKSGTIWNKPCKIVGVLREDDTNNHLLRTTLPVNFNSTPITVPIETDCAIGKRVFAVLEYMTAESKNEITTAIKDGKLTQVEFQETQWTYDKFGDKFVYSRPGFHGER